jgi:hypothetical protein
LLFVFTDSTRARRGRAAKENVLATNDGDRSLDDVVTMDAEPQHPTGALTFMLLYLMILAALWLNAYLRLWRD